MGAVDVGGSKPAGGSGGPSWKRPRVKIRIDMTPMVDIAFLLLIFFMVTTVFRLPQAMEMNLPEKNEDQKPTTQDIYGEKLLTVMVTKIGDRDSLAFMIGKKSPQPLAWDSLRGKLLERRALYGDSLTVLAKIHRQATYASMVNLVDEFNVAQTTRFSIMRYNTQDDSLLRVVGFTTPGPAGLPEPEVAESE